MRSENIDYKKLYEVEVEKNARLKGLYETAILEKSQAERKSIDIVNQYDGVLLELETLRAEYEESLSALIEAKNECEETRRTLAVIIKEIKKCNPRIIGADV